MQKQIRNINRNKKLPPKTLKPIKLNAVVFLLVFQWKVQEINEWNLFSVYAPAVRRVCIFIYWAVKCFHGRLPNTIASLIRYFNHFITARDASFLLTPSAIPSVPKINGDVSIMSKLEYILEAKRGARGCGYGGCNPKYLQLHFAYIFTFEDGQNLINS